MFTLTSFSSSERSSAIRSRTGETAWHGPHHSAQKSTITGLSLAITSCSKVVSVTSLAMHSPFGSRARLGDTRYLQRPNDGTHSARPWGRKHEGPPVGGPPRIERCLAGLAVHLGLRHVRERTARLVRVGARPAARRDQLLAQHREADVADVRRAGRRLDEVDAAAV